MLLTQREKVSVEIRKQINALSHLRSVDNDNLPPNNSNQQIKDQHRPHQKLARDERVPHHIFKGVADVAAQAIGLFLQDGEHGAKILQSLNKDVPINVNDVIIEELPESQVHR